MGAYNPSDITSVGQALLSQAIAGQGVLNWTKMQLSDTAIPPGTDPATLTTLTGVQATSAITGAGVYGGNVVQVSALFDNTGVAAAYNIETIGVWAKLDNGAETLIAVVRAQTPDVMPVYDANSPASYIFNLQMTVASASSITMAVNPAGTATVADLQAASAALQTQIDALNYYATGTFTAAGWSNSAPYTQTISVSGMTAGAHPGWDINTSSTSAAVLEGLQEAKNAITYIACGAGTVTAYCASDKPAVDLPVFFKGQ